MHNLHTLRPEGAWIAVIVRAVGTYRLEGLREFLHLVSQITLISGSRR